jgi:putative hydrolase of the HAD superfamily
MNQHPITIRAVIFDLGRVLVNIDSRLLVEKLFKGMDAANVQELGRRTMSDPSMIEFNCGRMSFSDFHYNMCETYDLELDLEAFTELWCQIFYTMEGMKELVAKIAPHIKIGLLSDTDPVHWNFICRRWSWIGAINQPTLSFEVGTMKPNPAI